MPNAESENAVRKADLKARTKEFALRVMKLSMRCLAHSRPGNSKSNHSKCDFSGRQLSAHAERVSRRIYCQNRVVEEEADETSFWLELIIDSACLLKNELSPAKRGWELVAIMAASRKSAIGNRKSEIQ